ncbi:conserved protein of unknown function [Mesotoga infera]|uniref:Uncharacterized protein n=2 Tax=Mesotoga infera TaxID=1236046 RepID=A0A7Z7LI77_9BACT|nr:conserved protein of unknown function [Mesotoga infera]
MRSSERLSMADVKVFNNEAVSVLTALFRLNNHERMIDRDAIAADSLARWVVKSRVAIPVELFEMIEVFFSWDSFFGLRTLPYVCFEGIDSCEAFMEWLEDLSPQSLMAKFFSPQYCEDGEARDHAFRRLELDEREALKYVFSNLELSNSGRYSAIEILRDQSRAKESFTGLLHFFCRKLFDDELREILRQSSRTFRELFDGNFSLYGLPFLRELLDIETTKESDEPDFYIFSSWFLGGSVITASLPERNSVISIVGEEMIKKRNVLLAVPNALEIARTLSMDGSMKLLRVLMNRRMNIESIIEETGLHRHGLIEKLAALSRQRLVVTGVSGDEFWFETGEQLIDKALLTMRDIMVEKRVVGHPLK